MSLQSSTAFTTIAIAVASIAINLLSNEKGQKSLEDAISRLEMSIARTTTSSSKPKAVILGHGISSSRLAHMEEIVSAIQHHGYAVEFELPEDTSSINLIWSFEWPFHHQQLRKIYATQMINHFPKSSILTNKVELVTAQTGLTPIAYRMPEQYEEWLNYSKRNVEIKWLTKANSHRGIAIIDPSTYFPMGGSFIQQFIASPLLIDNFKVDLGVYVLITSVVPLRVYILEHEVWIRSCPKPYHPFDPNDTRKYVVDADHIPPWELPSFAQFSREGSTLKQAFEQYLATRGYDPHDLFGKIYGIIFKLFAKLGYQIASFPYSGDEEIWTDPGLSIDGVSKHFDLLRFDFLIEIEKNSILKPWLMEANFSPNLWAGRLPPNRRIYRQIMFDVLSIVGANSNWQTEFFDSQDVGLVSDQDLHVPRPACFAGLEAADEMTQLICEKRYPSSFVKTLKQTTMEHFSRRHFRRLIPPEPNANLSLHDFNSWLKELNYSITMADKALSTWIFLKCQSERIWCA